MKDELRKQALSKRKALSQEAWEQASNTIQKQVLQTEVYKNAKTIALYASHNNEVDCTTLFKLATSEGKTCAFPRTKEGEMQFHSIQSLDQLTPGNYDILEPTPEAPLIQPKEIDLILCPGSVFDKKGNRIGYGKGYYDKFLKQINATKIGLAFSFQIVDDVPAEDHDVPMDTIVTEKGLIHP